MPPPVLVTTLLSLKGEIRRAQVKLNEDGTLDNAQLQAYFRKKSEPSVIGQLTHGEHTLYIMGYSEGKSGTENKYVLPAPYDKITMYGDALIIAAATGSSWTNPVTYLPLTWENYLKAQAQAQNQQQESAKPKKIVQDDEPEEDPVSEDEELARHEDEESEAEDEDALSETEEIELEEEEEEKPLVPKKKKKAANSATLSGYQRQNILLMSESKNELQPNSENDSVMRKKCYSRFEFMNLDAAELKEFEQEIFTAALEEAKRKHIFAHWDNKLFEEIYVQRQRRLFSNLHPSSPVNNFHLLERVKRGELTMAEVTRLSDIELFPTNWAKLQEQQQIREHKWLEGNTSMKSDKFVCSRCHKRECSYYELQTRSADEPMTVFITCLNCNKKWRN